MEVLEILDLEIFGVMAMAAGVESDVRDGTGWESMTQLR